jgi:hypothetical protein
MTRFVHRARRISRPWIVIGIAALVAFSMPMSSRLHAHADSLAGSQGTDTSLPDDPSSTVTVAGRGEFSSLRVKVNETRNLVNQAVSVSWTGAPPTFSDETTNTFSNAFAGNYLQIFQCWGDPDPSDPLNATDPGPPPTQCQFGAESNNPTSAYPIKEVGFEYSRVLSQPTWSTYDTGAGWLDTSTNDVIEPFKAVDGTVVNQEADYNAAADPQNPKPFWQNPYFSFNTSNEVPFARTYPDAGDALGHGNQLFEVQTGLEAPGLGCGQNLQPVAGGTKRPQCWLVVVPRGTPAEENPAGLTGVSGVVTSPLTPSAWANRIAIPLDFKPVDSSCALGTDERRIIGSELAVSAITSWQPALCATPSSPPYSYSYVSDDQARTNLTQTGFGVAGMSVFSNPPDPASVDPKHPVVYSPLTLSSEVIGFNIERTPALGSDGEPLADEDPLSGVRVEHIQLTPRLVAKLLTQSYQAQLVDVLATKPAAYSWVLNNPTSIVSDPDFVRFNPEFALLSTKQEIDASGLVVEEPTSDAALALWKWVLADPEAKQWLDGTPDQWGMKVNPIYSTVAANNSTGAAFGTPTPNLFPKSEPYCYDSGQTVGSPAQPARPICVLDWSPYALTLQAAAQAAGSANSGAHTTLDPTATAETAWAANGPQRAGTRFILSVTDSASAAQYGLQTAGLSRAGDDGSSRTFITPDDPNSVLAAVNAMKPSAPSGVLTSDPSAAAPGAYPLSLLTYAGTVPSGLTAKERVDYAAFLKFATGAGQTSGVGAGQLPAGYVPLPAALRAKAAAAITASLHPPVKKPPVKKPPVKKPTKRHVTTSASGSTGGTTDTGGIPSSDGTADSSSFTDTGSSSDVATTTPPPATSTKSPPLKTVRIVQPAAVTQSVHVGAVRFAFPILLILGLVALGAALFRKPRRRDGTEPLPRADNAAPPAPPQTPTTTPSPAGSTRTSSVFEPW